MPDISEETVHSPLKRRSSRHAVGSVGVANVPETSSYARTPPNGTSNSRSEVVCASTHPDARSPSTRLSASHPTEAQLIVLCPPGLETVTPAVGVFSPDVKKRTSPSWSAASGLAPAVMFRR